MKNVATILIVLGAFGALGTKFEVFFGEIGIDIKVENALKSALLETTRRL